jgi:hypothetical protein
MVTASNLPLEKAGLITRKCPFCDECIQDSAGKDINFIVHCGRGTQKHLSKKEWADYIERMNLRAF